MSTVPSSPLPAAPANFALMQGTNKIAIRFPDGRVFLVKTEIYEKCIAELSKSSGTGVEYKATIPSESAVYKEIFGKKFDKSNKS